MRANAEIVPVGTVGTKSFSWLRIVLVVSVVLVALAGVAGGVAYGAREHSRQYEDRLLPGTVIEGVDVSGLSAPEALSAVKKVIAPRLHHRIVVTWGPRKWRLTPRELGARSDARSAVEAAMAASSQTTFWDHVEMRWLDERFEFTNGVGVTHPKGGVREFVGKLAKTIYEEPVDASMDYSSGWVEISPEKKGRKVVTHKARAALYEAMRKPRPAKVAVPIAPLEPEVTRAAYDQVLLVRIGENKLYLYNDGDITHSWTVATGQPEYMTPTGTYSVTEKRYMPTWVNPAPDTWGASLPAEIPPGPDNPLGLRAINWSAPAIRFHGTEATYSLGYNASHGCVRMSNPDVVELYDMIEVGAPIVSVVAGSLKPLYADAPDPTPVADSGGGGGGSGSGGSGGGGSGGGGSGGESQGDGDR
jgi:lipoprotein-anchoring transpeptidase ErfK/SrfK